MRPPSGRFPAEGWVVDVQLPGRRFGDRRGLNPSTHMGVEAWRIMVEAAIMLPSWGLGLPGFKLWGSGFLELSPKPQAPFLGLEHGYWVLPRTTFETEAQPQTINPKPHTPKDLNPQSPQNAKSPSAY